MKTKEFDYYLPLELIAQKPAEVRSDSKLLVLDCAGGGISDRRFSDIGDFLLPGDCLVLNDTKVVPARFFARRQTGGKLEGLFLEEVENGLWEIMLKGSGKVKSGETIFLVDQSKKDFCQAELVEKSQQGRCKIRVHSDIEVEAILEEIGFPPLPPYIKRADDAEQAAIDKVRYQTVYAAKSGAVAAPTAGLHFTGELINRLKNKGVEFAYITLHVGAGTFKPVTQENLEDHHIHKEFFNIDRENAAVINSAKQKGRRIIAVGTTSIRTLETLAQAGKIEAGAGSTQLFIMPGFEFKIVDAVITNFHLPKSTLLALVAAFTGLENIRAAYQHAIEEKYRFYSYGDAMLII